MQHLNRGMMGRYEIPERFPAKVNAVQFGLVERLLGVVDARIDAAQAGVGIAALDTGADGSARDVLVNVRKSVDEFVEDAEQFDDLTMLCLEYKG